jgi:hypothetical protein
VGTGVGVVTGGRVVVGGVPLLGLEPPQAWKATTIEQATTGRKAGLIMRIVL